MNARWMAMAVAGAGCLAMTAIAARAEDGENDAFNVQQVKVPLSQAVEIAEVKASGRASKAEFEKGAEGWIFDIEVVAENSVKDVHVNAETGDVLSITEDEIDSDDAEDPAD